MLGEEIDVESENHLRLQVPTGAGCPCPLFFALLVIHFPQLK